MEASESERANDGRPSLSPVILPSVSLPHLLQHLIRSQERPTTLVVCSTREDFLHDLLHALAASSSVTVASVAGDTGGRSTALQEALLHPLLVPTLQLLSASQNVTVAFCPSLPTLHAYLSAHPSRIASALSDHPHNRTSTPVFLLLNSIALHRNTSAFSAQGLSRTFAAAVEAAHFARQRLTIVECPLDDSDQCAEHEDGLEDRERAEARQQAATTSDSWDEEVSILNVTTKSFGAGERGWVGRTVKIRQVVGRWGVFATIDDL
ncbi:hypothetical protein BJ546DRAFT_532146 [Cryomyces antarcticus]